MQQLTSPLTTQISGAGIPMPTPHLNGPTVSQETADFIHHHGATLAAGMAGSTIGATAGALGGPVGVIIGGAIGAVVAESIKGGIASHATR
jgi:hypothetical protein